MLPRRSATEVCSGDENLRAAVLGAVEEEVALPAPVVEEERAVARTLDAFEELLGNDLVGVDVGAVQRSHDAGDAGERFHQLNALTSTRCPAMAAAAAIGGLTRWVRPPLPCRPSKLRLLVEAQRSPGPRMSGFIPRHIEQPDSRHSKPASRKIRSRPSVSAARLMFCDPGTTIARTDWCTRWPLIIRAAARKSSTREFVHEPMNTRSISMSAIFVRGSRFMYSSARSMARRSLSLFASDGSGTAPVIASTMPGFVPQVTHGAIPAASRSTVRSNSASGSDGNVRQ